MPTILVVDDSLVDRRIVEGLLEREADLDWLVEFADNGVQALVKMQDLLIDVVVTDLQMPEMNGLELVTAVGATYPEVPVILMTGQGSEAIAIEALDKGAASYVPKNRLAERLIGTITQVLDTSHAEKGHQDVSQCIADAQLNLCLDNEVQMIRPVVDYFTRMIDEMGFCDQAERVHVAVALEEALFNAMFHGNLELPRDQVQQARSPANQNAFLDLAKQRRQQAPFADRRVFLNAALNSSEVRFVIRDQGPGFEMDQIPERNDPKTIEDASGRGLVLMKNFMDEVTYDRARNELTLIKRGTPEAES